MRLYLGYRPKDAKALAIRTLDDGDARAWTSRRSTPDRPGLDVLSAQTLVVAHSPASGRRCDEPEVFSNRPNASEDAPLADSHPAKKISSVRAAGDGELGAISSDNAGGRNGLRAGRGLYKDAAAPAATP